MVLCFQREIGLQTLDQQATILQELRLRQDAPKPYDPDAAVGNSAVEYISAQLDWSDSKVKKETLRQQSLTAIYESNQGKTKSGQSPSPSVSVRRKQALQERFIENFYYSHMDNREERIAEAHEKTFQWI